MRKINLLLVIAIAFFSIGCKEAENKKAELSLSNTWVKLPEPGQKMTAGFVTIENGTEKKDKLVSASSGIAEVHELHTMVTENEVMKMRKVESIEIPAGESVALKPGGYHVMFIRLTDELQEGENVDLTLTFENAGEKKLSAPVKAYSHNMKHE